MRNIEELLSAQPSEGKTEIPVCTEEGRLLMSEKAWVETGLEGTAGSLRCFQKYHFHGKIFVWRELAVVVKSKQGGVIVEHKPYLVS